MEFEEIEDAPPIVVSVFDYDKFGNNDLLGLTIVKMMNAELNNS